MKYLLSLVAFLIIQTIAAQDIDSTLIFETEEVMEFKRQTIVEEFLISRDAKINSTRLVRLGISGISSREIYRVNGSVFIDGMIKLKETAALWGGVNIPSNYLGGPYANPFLGIRLYPGMRKRIEQGVQGNNFSGKYVSLAAGYQVNYTSSDERVRYSQTGKNLNKTNFIINYGVQLGNAMDFSLELGLRGYNQIKVGQNGILEPVNPNELFFTPYIATKTHLTLGLDNAENRGKDCDFLKCHREQKRMVKVGLANLFNLSADYIAFSPDFGFEQRIGNSYFTTNSIASIGYFRTKQFNQVGTQIKVDTQNGNLIKLPEYSKELEINNFFSINLAQELRYYVSQKHQITKGIGAKNLSGIYFNGIAVFNSNFGDIPNFEFQLVRPPFNMGLGGGIQSMVGSKHFVDFQMEAFYNTLTNSVDLHSKMIFGLAR